MGKVILFVAVFLPGALSLVLWLHRRADEKEVRFWALLSAFGVLVCSVFLVVVAHGGLNVGQARYASSFVPWRWESGPAVRLEFDLDPSIAWMLPVVAIIVCAELVNERSGEGSVRHLGILLLATSAFGALTADNVLVGYLFLVLSTPATACVLAGSSRPEEIQAARNVVIRLIAADLALLFAAILGPCLVFVDTGDWTFSAEQLAVRLRPTSGVDVSLLLVVATALAFRAGIFPFHRWLVRDAPRGGASGSAVICVLPLMGFGTISRLLAVSSATWEGATWVFPVSIVVALGAVILAVSAANAAEPRFRLAYLVSSNLSLGFVALAGGLELANPKGPFAAGIWFVCGVMIAAAGLFLLMNGSARQPGLALVCIASLIGLPPFVGFISRLQLLHLSWLIDPRVFALALLATPINAVAVLMLTRVGETTARTSTRPLTIGVMGAMILALVGGGLFHAPAGRPRVAERMRTPSPAWTDLDRTPTSFRSAMRDWGTRATRTTRP